MTTPLQNFDPDSPLLVVQGTLTLGKIMLLQDRVVLKPTSPIILDTDFGARSLFALSSLAVLGSATGATLAAFKAQNPFALGMNMGLNGSIAGLTFFGKLQRWHGALSFL